MLKKLLIKSVISLPGFFISRLRSHMILVMISMIGISGCCNLNLDRNYQNIAEGEYVKLTNYFVKSKDYPVYYFKEEQKAPPLHGDRYGAVEDIQLSILPSDRWVVTHKFEGGVVLYSEAYYQRQCTFLNERLGGYRNLFGKCNDPTGYAIVVDGNNKVLGWSLAINSKGAVSYCRRYFNPKAYDGSGWEDVNISFVEKTIETKDQSFSLDGVGDFLKYPWIK